MKQEFVKVFYETMALKGGLDQITPTLSLPPGVLRDALNFECLENGGYGRIGGYERYSGQPAPSDAVYALLYVSSFTNTPSVGQTITNAGATATGTIIAVGNNYIAYTEATGAFTIGDTLKVGATVIGTLITPQGAMSSSVNAQYVNLAANVYRADIAKPVGSGPIRGVFVLDDLTYCLRDNAGATAMNLWEQSSAGWVQVPFFKKVSFTVGAVAVPADGATLTQAGVTATVKRVVKQSGAWTGTAAGILVITNVSGGNFAAGAATLTGGATVTLSGIQTDITLLDGGRCEITQANFFGQASGIRVYCADGVNPMWEFDGETLVPIYTGLTTDTPLHVSAFKNHLFYSYESSAFCQGIGDPYNNTALGGAAEIACGDTVTGFIVQPGSQDSGAMTIFCRNSTNMLYGNSSADWNRVNYNIGTGSLDYSQQNLAQTFLCDDRGVFGLSTSLAFGNFQQSSLTNLLRPFFAEHRTRVSASMLARDKSQYRLFFSDNYGIYMTVVNGQLMGSVPVYFPMNITCTWECTLANGELVKFVGGSDGHVYQFDVGTSFDGEAINAYFTLNWASMRNSRMLKRFRRASIELSGPSYATVDFGYSLAYANPLTLQPNSQTYAAPFVTTQWDAFTWDNFVWDGRTLLPTECEMLGTGENVQITVRSNSTDYAPFAVNSVIVHYTPRRGLR